MVKTRCAQRAAFRPGTYSNLKCQLRTYLLFCIKFERIPFPVDPNTVSIYACFLADHFKSSNSVRNYISGIKTWATLLKFAVEDFYSPSVKLTLTGLDKLNTRIPNKKFPILIEHLKAIHSVINLNETNDVVLWTMILVAFFGMLRKSQFGAISRKDFKVTEQLTRADFTFTLEGLLIRVQWSKTQQKHNYIHEIPISSMTHSVLCPVTAYTHMINLIPGKSTDPAFGIPNQLGEIIPLSKSDIDRMLKLVLEKCGIDTNKYSFHSLRRGGASLASAVGATDSQICAIGHWVSSCYRGYISHSPSNLYQVSSKMLEVANHN